MGLAADCDCSSPGSDCIVYHYPCINIIYLHTDFSAGSAEGQTGTVSPWWVWLLVGIAAVTVLAFIVALFIKKKKR